ncbi:MAG: hypothetical protein ACXWUN_12865 [Allosphingosinicella sp.]
MTMPFIETALARARLAGDADLARRIEALGPQLERELRAGDGAGALADAAISERLAGLARSLEEPAVGYDRGGQDKVADDLWRERRGGPRGPRRGEGGWRRYPHS